MSEAISNLQAAQQKAMAGRPRVGGFPYLAETLRCAGVTRNVWHLPACASLYQTRLGSVIQQGTPLVSGTVDVPPFDEQALVAAIRTDQAGESTFPQFLLAAWQAGVVRYEVDFAERHVTYEGCCGESYVERYPAPPAQAAG
ncbi:hypothetical protein ASD68_04355 [Rhodanobacter sp. Root627]|uniref:DUF1398 domain-containing protein n=1 Tax=Rhodanobacter sp. Root627 TaxID=1736572 RepID=UPI0006F56B76|nr:DUF1398 family protein [Rhodanobacter sp. Root627]KRA35630.1 hypothetical protein ASD68_04355 [Rhodanobacter sp. Root627]